MIQNFRSDVSTSFYSDFTYIQLCGRLDNRFGNSKLTRIGESTKFKYRRLIVNNKLLHDTYAVVAQAVNSIMTTTN